MIITMTDDDKKRNKLNVKDVKNDQGEVHENDRKDQDLKMKSVSFCWDSISVRPIRIVNTLWSKWAKFKDVFNKFFNW